MKLICSAPNNCFFGAVSPEETTLTLDPSVAKNGVSVFRMIREATRCDDVGVLLKSSVILSTLRRLEEQSWGYPLPIRGKQCEQILKNSLSGVSCNLGRPRFFFSAKALLMEADATRHILHAQDEALRNTRFRSGW